MDDWVQDYLAKLTNGEKFAAGQPRDDSGRWTSGGGGVPSYPRIDQGPTAFMAKMQLEEAKLPDNHLDGLNLIAFEEGKYIQARTVSGSVVEAYGTYEPASGTITLSSNAEKGGNIGVYGGHTILHEVGHNVHMAKLTDDAASDWAGISRDGQSARISSYARTNRGEHFAECYRAYTRGGNERAKLRNLEPASYKFMQSLMGTRGEKKLLPPGTKKNVDEQFKRYSK